MYSVTPPIATTARTTSPAVLAEPSLLAGLTLMLATGLLLVAVGDGDAGGEE
jgi:hypothetical protein